MKLNIAWKIVFVIGFVSVFKGLDFFFIRPNFVFFPEDTRFTHLSFEQLQAYNGNLFTWIGFIFRSWGAFILATGIFMLGTSANGLRKKEKWAFATLTLAGILSLSVFLFVNIALRSDFVLEIGLLLASYIIALLLAYDEIFKKISR